MMNPLEFLFNSLSFLSYETELLEACDWDDDRCEIVKSELARVLSSHVEISISENTGSLFSKIEKELSKTLSEKEVKACLCILERCLSNFDRHLGGEYEN